MKGSRLWQTSLVARLVFYFLLLSLVTVAVLGSVAYVRAQAALRDAVFDSLEVEATLKSDALAHWVEEEQREFLLFTELTPVRGQIDDFVGLRRSDPAFQAAYDEVFRQASILVRRKSEWQEIMVLSGEGEVLLSTEPGHEKFYRTRDSFFIQGIREPYASKVYASAQSYTPTLTLAVPVGSAGAAGVLALHLDLARLDTILESTGLEVGESYLVDEVNVLVSSQRFGTEEFRRGVHSDGIEAAIAGKDGADVYESYKDVRVLGVYRYVEPLGAALLVEVPEEVAFTPARELLVVIVSVGLAVALILAAGTFLLARQIARPVLAVRDAAVRLSQGDMSSRAPRTTSDEVGTLAGAFNRMADHTGGLIAELEERNEELGRFTYTVSHDLKSPLVTIQGFLGFLEKDVEEGNSDRAREDVARIREAASTMQQLLEELLELSRIGRMMNPPEEVPLDSLVREVLAATEGPLARNGVDVDVGHHLGTVHGDRVRIREVFQNLVENAARFMGDQVEPRIEIGSEERSEDVLCWVRDNGIGIEPQYHTKVFGLFERLDASTEGTGIGLALVKGIVEHHGGRIWVESAGIGHGATFFFTLPAPP